MLAFMTRNPKGSFVALLLIIIAWPYVMEHWKAWRREQFLRNHPSVIIIPKASKPVDVWPTRLAKFVYNNAQDLSMLCFHAILSITATILRNVSEKLTQWFTHKPPAEETKPRVSSSPKEEEEKAASPKPAVVAIPSRIAAPPASVLKRRNPGERRRSLEPRVTFTESSNGTIATSYYYYNPSQQANQKSVPPRPTELHQTPVSVRPTTSRLPTPYPLEKQQPASSHGQWSLSTFNKENMPKPPAQLHKSHSPGQQQIRAAMEPVTSALRKRRIELDILANGSEKKRRIPVAGTRPAAMVRPTKRRERQQLIWEQLNNKRSKKDDDDASTVIVPTGNVPVASFVPPSATDNAFPLSSTKPASHGVPLEAAQESTAPATSSFQFGAPSTSREETPRADGLQSGSALSTNDVSAFSANSGFQFGATESTSGTETAANTTSFAFGAPRTSDEPKTADNAAAPSFAFGATSTEAPKTAAPSFAFEAANSAPDISEAQVANIAAPSFSFGATSSAAGASEVTKTAASNFAFGAADGAPGASEALKVTANGAAPSFAFGATSNSTGASDAHHSSFQFGNSLPSSTPPPQPAFKFGSSAENTPAPGPVSNGVFSATSFQFGGDNTAAVPSFGLPNNNFAPSFDTSSSSAPTFGATAAQVPMFGMGSPSAAANNSSRTRRLARRGRRVA